MCESVNDNFSMGVTGASAILESPLANDATVGRALHLSRTQCVLPPLVLLFTSLELHRALTCCYGVFPIARIPKKKSPHTYQGFVVRRPQSVGDLPFRAKY